MKYITLDVLGMIYLASFIVVTLGYRYGKIAHYESGFPLIDVILFSWAWPVALPLILVADFLRWINEKYKKFTRYPDE